jgi:two-component system chemotaxis response regulator CheB
VLVVDDSRIIRRIIREILGADPDLQIVGEAENGAEALELIPRLKPDVITLDINMPVMDGLTTLKHIMIKYPRPTLMFSTLTRDGANETFDALRYGAVDFLLKPSNTSVNEVEAQKKEIIEKIKMAADVAMESLRFVRRPMAVTEARTSPPSHMQALIGIGAAEGGYAALLKLIPWLEANLPAAVISMLYAAPQRVDSFVSYLSRHSALAVKRAKTGEMIKSGVCYLASGDEYITFSTDTEGHRMEVHTAPFPERQGSINRLFFSIAEILQDRSAGVILTGRGQDGAEGLGEIKRAGGLSLVQDPQYSLWSEMPRAAIEKAPVDRIISNYGLVQEIKNFIANRDINPG